MGVLQRLGLVHAAGSPKLINVVMADVEAQATTACGSKRDRCGHKVKTLRCAAGTSEATRNCSSTCRRKRVFFAQRRLLVTPRPAGTNSCLGSQTRAGPRGRWPAAPCEVTAQGAQGSRAKLGLLAACMPLCISVHFDSPMMHAPGRGGAFHLPLGNDSPSFPNCVGASCINATVLRPATSLPILHSPTNYPKRRTRQFDIDRFILTSTTPYTEASNDDSTDASEQVQWPL